jgi:hypothetical protein
MAGAALAAAIAPVVARAAAGITPGALRGYIDILSPDGRVEGWAQDVLHPELPVWLDILSDGRHIASMLSCQMRADLRTAGIGSGKHAFMVKMAACDPARIEIRRAVDGARLELTEAAQAA